MKRFEPKIQAFNLLSDLINSKLIAYRDNLASTSASLLCLNLNDVACEYFKQILPQCKIERCDFSNIPDSTHKPFDAIIGNLAISTQVVNPIAVLNAVQPLLVKNGVFIFIILQHYSKDLLQTLLKNQHVYDDAMKICELEKPDVKFKSYREHLFYLSPLTAVVARVFVVDTKDINTLKTILQAKEEQEAYGAEEEEVDFDFNELDKEDDLK